MAIEEWAEILALIGVMLYASFRFIRMLLRRYF